MWVSTTLGCSTLVPPCQLDCLGYCRLAAQICPRGGVCVDVVSFGSHNRAAAWCALKPCQGFLKWLLKLGGVSCSSCLMPLGVFLEHDRVCTAFWSTIMYALPS